MHLNQGEKKILYEKLVIMFLKQQLLKLSPTKGEKVFGRTRAKHMIALDFAPNAFILMFLSEIDSLYRNGSYAGKNLRGIFQECIALKHNNYFNVKKRRRRNEN